MSKSVKDRNGLEDLLNALADSVEFVIPRAQLVIAGKPETSATQESLLFL